MRKALMLGASVALSITLLGVNAGYAEAGTFNFSFTSKPGYDNNSGSGTFTVSDALNPDGSYNITGIRGIVSAINPDGEVTSETITGLSSGYYRDLDGAPDLPDNKLFTTGKTFDHHGVNFSTTDNLQYSFYSSNIHDRLYDQYYDPTNQSTFDNLSAVAFEIALVSDPSDSISAAPEPSMWALMLMGVGGLGMMLRRRRSLVTLATA